LAWFLPKRIRKILKMHENVISTNLECLEWTGGKLHFDPLMVWGMEDRNQPQLCADAPGPGTFSPLLRKSGPNGGLALAALIRTLT
jgi:hypothetical protein